MITEELKQSLLNLIKFSTNTEDTLQKICNLLVESVPYYNWVGFYFADAEKKVLHLGPYKGLLTDHTIIPFGKGICGQVAESNETFVVENVLVQDNYISCNIDVKSEIVVPLFVEGKNIGQIDIDSNTINAFTKEDQDFLEWLTSEISILYK